MEIMKQIENGRCSLGIELGSTRIKAVLIGEDHAPIASGEYAWENQLKDGLWTYALEDVWKGLQGAYASLKEDVRARYGVTLKTCAAMGFSAMMHGYLAFDKDGELLVPFRTWRNTNTGEAAAKLSELFGFNIPLRWSISHLYQAMLDHEPHVPHIASITTLAGYVHEKLTGRHVLGIGDASGMFPIDSATKDYDEAMLQKFDALCSERPWSSLRELLPKALNAGEEAGRLSAEGAKLLDPEGDLMPGILLAPPEGDAGTGMTATDSVRPRTGNVSAGTSIFAMIVLERPLSKLYPQIDIVATPTGATVAMVHCNNCTSEINAWAGLLRDFSQACGAELDMGKIFTAIFRSAMEGEKDCGGLVNYGFLSGEPVVGLNEGRPLLMRLPDAKLSFANFARAQVLSAMAGLKLGMGILEEEKAGLDILTGHGGFFKTPGTAQSLMASALNTPITTMETAGEGGAWGMALLAAFAVNKGDMCLEDYLHERVFAAASKLTIAPDAEDTAGFLKYMERFNASIAAEKEAVATLKD